MISILVVNFNSGDHLRSCLQSIYSWVRVPYEVVIVDNNSTDKSLTDLPPIVRLKVIREFNNHGFSKGCNLAFAGSSGSHVHFLNPDTQVSESINSAYQSLLNSTDQRIFVTQIEDISGNRVPSSFAFPTFANIFWAVLNPKRLTKWYLGASVMMSRKVYSDLGGFSEDYFMYCDDVDLFYRAHQNGVAVTMLPVSVCHVSGGSSSSVWKPEERLELVERSAFIFTHKFGLRSSYFIFKHLAALKALLKGRVYVVRELRIYWRGLIFGFGKAHEVPSRVI